VSVRASNAKTRVPRVLPILPLTAQAIKKLIGAHHAGWNTQLIFTTYDGHALNKHSWGMRLLKYSKAIGSRVRPYDLRHCFALYFLRSGGDVFSLQRLMGHSNLSMTKKYLALTDSDLETQHTQHSPINSLAKTKRLQKIK
jgi:site-specific recombinase XerD